MDYRDSSYVTSDLVGYRVEAIDGHIGKVDEASNEVDLNYIVVDTGPWIFGKKVLLPAGVIGSVDNEAETVHVNRTKDQIKASPEFRRELPRRGVPRRNRYVLRPERTRLARLVRAVRAGGQVAGWGSRGPLVERLPLCW